MSTPGPQLTFFTRIAALASIAALAACADSTTNDLLAPDQALANRESADRADGGVFVSTNDANANAIKAFTRAADGSLSPLGTFATGGKGVGGVGDPLTSQSAVTLSPDHRFLFVVNAGSNDVSVFRIKRDGLKLVDRASSGGVFPVSIAATEDELYVLNATSNDVGIFHVDASGNLDPVDNAALSANASGGTEVRVSPDGRILNVTERLSNTFDSFIIREDGRLSQPISSTSAGQTPFGFDYTPSGVVVVSEAGSAAASSYSQARSGALSAISSSISNGGQAAPCWLVIDGRGKFAYTANAGGSSISGFAISNDGSLTLITPGGRTGDLGQGANPLDIGFSADSRFLYVLKNGTGTIGAFVVNSTGTLTSLADTPGLAAQVGYMGLAAF